MISPLCVNNSNCYSPHVIRKRCVRWRRPCRGAAATHAARGWPEPRELSERRHGGRRPPNLQAPSAAAPAPLNAL